MPPLLNDKPCSFHFIPTIPMLFSSALLPAHNALLHILRLRLTYLSGACFIAFRCVHPFSGNAACSLWCGYCIVYCAIPDRDPSFVNTMLLFSGTLSLFQSGVWHIHDHGTPLRCTFTATYICVSCSGSAS
ncbi:MAG: hypothetical protein IPJ51_19715 [Saprospiraceae bacterium]|nr:hypothetical protein [Saprospiraceae bacterium]